MAANMKATEQPIASTMETNDLFGTITPLDVRPKATNLESFEVATDSVVATARIVTNKLTKRIFIDWGDGQTDTINTLPGVLLPAPFGQPDPLPEGTFEIYHVYDEPEDRRPFEHTLLLQVQNTDGDDDLRLRTITLTPRYRIVQYRCYVRLLNPCDVGGSTSEFDITQHVGADEVGRWRWKPSNNFFSEGIYQVLEGSQFSRDLSANDTGITFALDFKETDLLIDDTGRHSRFLNAFTESERVETDVEVSGGFGGCKVSLRYDREVSLIADVPSNGAQSVQAVFARSP